MCTSLGRPDDWKTSISGRSVTQGRTTDDLEERQRQAWLSTMNERYLAGETLGSSGYWDTEQAATIEGARLEALKDVDPAPTDETATFFKEASRAETDRRLRKTGSRSNVGGGTLL